MINGNSIRYLSLFSGIEACSVAWKSLGWQCVGFSEIEPFPCSVLQHHYPNIPNLGDVTKITEQQIADLGEFDVLVFGSPCQDLSVVGSRKGLQDGTRSNLFYEAMRIFDYARKHNKCRFALWENVPGAFSSNKGADFAKVVGEMAGLHDITTPSHGWGNTGVALGENGLLEWRVLDAQYFGLAQRRKRVFAILDTGNWQDRPPILFEQESVRGDSPPSRTQGCEVTAITRDGITTAVYGLDSQQPPARLSEELSQTMLASMYKEPLGVFSYTIHADPTTKISDGVSGTLRSQGGGGIVPPSVVYGFCPRFQVGGKQLSLTLTASDAKDPKCVATDFMIRRLTPTECERLMGFPDGYTDVQHNNKPPAKSARYKALGNSMAVPVMHWIGKQITQVLKNRFGE